ncbi:MAG: hypothetical protein Q8M80_01815 [Hydrogenophaga sp.]|uniref:COG3904 family protein n=1 Tax=Hydrogenophaga sp. TaxID=1904254 RepID=UPI00271CC727|nr:hypothetical protein [Hydrogenophaga sp.]MDO9505575.1 hypothetical protein [Hydrogenophaga sp.]MDP3202784.1 hypothetical protein [Hydrogenophaga sp.]MDP3629041.1 hypothetical protein [Hydrogenophaga sp.]
MPRLQRLAVVRNWSERHAHRQIKLAEDEEGRLWLQLDDLRQWMPGMPKDNELALKHPEQVRLADASSHPYLEASALVWLTRKSTNAPTLKLVAWLESSVLAPARQRHQWADYQGHDGMAKYRDVLPANVEKIVRSVEGAPWWKLERDPRFWVITQGHWSPLNTLVMGFALALLAMGAANWLEGKTWDVENSYLFWLWAAVVVTTWALVWIGAWIVGAMRSSARRVGEGLAPWLAVGGLVGNMVVALAMAFDVTTSLGALLHGWWSYYAKGLDAVSITAVRSASGEVTRLKIVGDMGVGSTRALMSALAQHPQVRVLEITSPGGLLTEGHGMARLALQRTLNTEVSGACASACTLVFVAGERRLLAPQASLGFHRSHRLGEGFSTGWSSVDHFVANFYRTRGVPEEFIQRALGTPGWDLWEPGNERLIKAGVVTDEIRSVDGSVPGGLSATEQKEDGDTSR